MKHQEDQFEEFLRKHREELDVEEPDVNAIWEGVRQQTGRRRSLPVRWMAAASVALLVGSLIFYGLSSNNTIEDPPPIVLSEPTVDDPIFAAEEARMVQLVKDKEANLNLSAVDRQKYHDLFVELNLLEELHEEFKNDLPEFGEKDKLLKTLMKNYERRLQILDRLSNEMERREKEEEREVSL